MLSRSCPPIHRRVLQRQTQRLTASFDTLLPAPAGGAYGDGFAVLADCYGPAPSSYPRPLDSVSLANCFHGPGAAGTPPRTGWALCAATFAAKSIITPSRKPSRIDLTKASTSTPRNKIKSPASTVGCQRETICRWTALISATALRRERRRCRGRVAHL